MLPGYVVPGQLIVASTDANYSKYINGYGTAIEGRGLVASLVGKLNLVQDAASGKEKEKYVVQVHNSVKNPYGEIPNKETGNSKRNTSMIPQVGGVVYARVQRLGPSQVNLDIIAVENRGNITSDTDVGVNASSLGSIHPSVGVNDKTNELGMGYGGVIRIQDIRATEREKVKVNSMFSPGDLVRAVVLSLGDGNKFYLSTVRNDLGVVFARDPVTGVQLVPLDWQMMANPITGATSFRKCANPFV